MIRPRGKLLWSGGTIHDTAQGKPIGIHDTVWRKNTFYGHGKVLWAVKVLWVGEISPFLTMINLCHTRN